MASPRDRAPDARVTRALEVLEACERLDIAHRGGVQATREPERWITMLRTGQYLSRPSLGELLVALAKGRA